MSSTEELIQQFGGREQVRKVIQSRQRSHFALSEQYDDLARAHPREWVAFHDGHLAARGVSLKDLLQGVDRKNIQRDHAIVRFLDPEPKVWIL